MLATLAIGAVILPLFTIIILIPHW
jgi:hypothetical protein